MALSEKVLLKTLAKIIVWNLKKQTSKSDFEVFYGTIPKDIQQILCAIRYFGRGDFENFKDALEYIKNPDNFNDRDLIEKITGISPDTLENQFNKGFEKMA